MKHMQLSSPAALAALAIFAAAFFAATEYRASAAACLASKRVGMADEPTLLMHGADEPDMTPCSECRGFEGLVLMEPYRTMYAANPEAGCLVSSDLCMGERDISK